MAQDDDTQFQSILDELRRAQEIEDQNVQIQQELEEHSESIESLQEQTTELTEKVGVDDKEKNVIDKNKLPATLTSAEKKRYQNIGKVFIEGAGGEFKRILKASKFKSMMSTVKEKFQAGVNKVKSAIKKAKKTGGFLAKLLLIAGLLGTIFYLFKDKIKDAIPNITNYIKDIFEKARSFIGNLVENGFNVVADGAKAILGESIIKIIGYLKDTVQIFFSETLPNSIYELYLNVLSLFSSDAEDMQEELKNDDAAKSLGSQASQITEQAKQEVKEGADENIINESAEFLSKTANNFQELSEGQLNQLEVATSNAQFADQQNKDALINELDGLLAGGESIIQMINDGRVDAKRMFENIRQANADGNLTREEAFKAIQDSIENEAAREKLKFRELTSTLQNGANGSTVVLDDNRLGNAAHSAIGAANAYRDAAASQGVTSLQTLIDVANRDKENHDRINAEITRRNQEQAKENREQIRNANEEGNALLKENTNVTLNATKVISETLQTTFVDLSAAIKKFLNGDDISKNIVSSLQSLNNSFTQYFNEVKNGVKIMLDQLTTVASYFINFFGKVNEIIDANPSILGSTEENQNEGNRPKTLAREFVINVDVKFDSQRRSEQSFIKDVVSIDVELNETLEETNEVLSKITDAISRVTTDSENKTTVVNISNIVEQVTENITNNSEVINVVTNKVEQKLSSNVTNNVNIIENRMDSSVVEIVDKQGRSNTLTLVDKKTNDNELNMIRADIRTLANYAKQNRDQISRNSLQVSKIVNIGNISTEATEPITLCPLPALSV